MNKIKKTALNAMAFASPCSFCIVHKYRDIIQYMHPPCTSPCTTCVVFGGDDQPIFVNKEITIKIPKRRF